MSKSKTLKGKAESALERKAFQEQYRSFRQEVLSKFNPKNWKQLKFYMCYILNGGNGQAAYKEAYGQHIGDSVASTRASYLLRNVDMPDLMDAMGLGIDSFLEAMNNLRKSDPKGYMQFWTKLRRLDIERHEITGKDGAALKLEFVDQEVE